MGRDCPVVQAPGLVACGPAVDLPSLECGRLVHCPSRQKSGGPSGAWHGTRGGRGWGALGDAGVSFLHALHLVYLFCSCVFGIA